MRRILIMSCAVLLATTGGYTQSQSLQGTYVEDKQGKSTLLESYLRFLVKDGMRNIYGEPQDQPSIYKEYDFIVVGAGSAGCVVANRLSEIPDWNVLLIEAGGEENALMDVPILVNYFQFSDANWKYKTEPSSRYCLGMENRQCHWPRGRVMGGSSVLNYMIYTRGNKVDYDNWEKLGNKDWGWDKVFPYFKKLEDTTDANYAMHKEWQKRKGYLSVTDVPYQTQIGKAFIESGLSMGYPILDHESPNLFGFNHLIVSMKNGTRCSSSRAFLHPVRNRKNLHVKKKSFVTKVLIDPVTNIAKGVEVIIKGKKYVVKARKEVILSSGSINSPQLLMLSGVGPAKHLRRKNITVLQDLKVGYNLQDHYMAGGLTYLMKEKYTTHAERIVNKITMTNYLTSHDGPMASPGGCEAFALLNVGNTTVDEGPNMEILLINGGLSSDAILSRTFNLNASLYNKIYKPLKNEDAFMTFPVLLSTKSRGRILLRDNNPFHHPLIYPNYFSDPEGYDMKTIIAGIRKSNEIMTMGPMRKFGTRLMETSLPPCEKHTFDSDEYWECFARYMTFTIYHPVGTCKMGPDSDPDAVVDDRLRVKGIRNLRVIDASIMPIIPTAHTNAPTYMVGEKGSDMIKQDWGLTV